MTLLHHQTGESDFASLFRWLRGAIVANYGAFSVSLLCSVISIPILLKRLGAEQFGVYTLALSLATLAQFPFSGLVTGASRIVPGAGPEHATGAARALLRAGSLAVLAASSALGTIILAALFLLPAGFLPAAQQNTFAVVRTGFALACLGLPARCASYLMEGILLGLFRFRVAAVIRSAGSVTQAAGAIAVVLAGGSVRALVIFWASASVLLVLAQAATILLALRGQAPTSQPSWPLLKSLVAQTGWLGLEAGADGVAAEVDKLIVSVWASVSAAGYYAIAFRIPAMLLTMICQYTSLYTPIAAAAEGSGNRASLKTVLLRANAQIWMVFLPIAAGLAVWARPLLAWWVSSHSGPIVPLLRVALVIAAVQATQQVTYALLYGLNRVRPLGVIACWQTLLRVALSLWLVRRFGATGVALGALAAVLVGEAVFRSNVLLKSLQLPAKDWVRALLLPAAGSGAVLVAALSLARAQTRWFVQALLAAFSLALFAWVWRRMSATSPALERRAAITKAAAV